ncbi:unnamed protein product [Spirodela intermedia]|uniref:Uncharacterized protein n=1 Tax=Spirodela intermedia TaxID=51605 RepID=A0A7I8KCS1_SPIIN|nr:unnamed protein product [Spirodela intermedia]
MKLMSQSCGIRKHASVECVCVCVRERRRRRRRRRSLFHLFVLRKVESILTYLCFS